MKYTHLFWDWNGTLLNDGALCLEVLNTLLAEEGLAPIDMPMYRSHFGFPISAFYAKMGLNTSPQHLNGLFERFLERYEPHSHRCDLQPDALVMLQAFQAEGLSQSILSAHEQEPLRRLVNRLGLGGFFEHVFGDPRGRGQGKIPVGQALLKATGAAPEKVLLIGDMIHDHEVAQALGIDCVLFEHGHNNRERLEPLGVPVISSFNQVSDYFCTRV